MKGSTLLTAILILSSFGLTGFFVTENLRLEEESVSLQGMLGEANSEIEGLEETLSDMEKAKSDMEEQMEGLETELDAVYLEKAEMQFNLTSLKLQYSTLRSDLEGLNSSYTVETELGIGNSLTSFYDVLRYEVGLSGYKSTYHPEREIVKFAANLALHDLGVNSWPTIEKNYYKDVGAHSYEQAKEQMRKALEYTGVQEPDSDVERVRKILEFVNERVEYEYETDDVCRAPVETLSLGSGDCDDYSTLAAALFEASGIESAVGFFENSEGSGHVMVLLRMEDLGAYDLYYFSDLTAYGLSPGKWIEIEPQRPIEHQGDEDWMSQWDIKAAAEVPFK